MLKVYILSIVQRFYAYSAMDMREFFKVNFLVYSFIGFSHSVDKSLQFEIMFNLPPEISHTCMKIIYTSSLYSHRLQGYQ